MEKVILYVCESKGKISQIVDKEIFPDVLFDPELREKVSALAMEYFAGRHLDLEGKNLSERLFIEDLETFCESKLEKRKLDEFVAFIQKEMFPAFISNTSIFGKNESSACVIV